MSQLSQKLHYKLDGTTDEITLYSTLAEVNNKGLNVKVNGINAYAGYGTETDGEVSRMNYKPPTEVAQKVLKQAGGPVLLNLFGYRNNEDLLQALPETRVIKGSYVHFNNENAPTISGYDFVCALPNCFIATEDITVKLYYIPQSVPDRTKTNWSSAFKDASGDLSLQDFANTFVATNFSYLFNSSSIVKPPKLNTSNVTDMTNMFRNCTNLQSLDLSLFDTSKVTDMRYMFSGCEALTNLDLSNFNTAKVTDMSDMFQYCKALTNLDISNFDTSNVTAMGYMFYSCEALTNLDISNFDTSNVTDMRYMFSGCEALTNLDLSNFNTSNVTNMSFMFRYCYALTNLDLSNFNTAKVANMRDMFFFCDALTNLDISNFDTSKVTDMSRMFYNCEALTNLDLSNFNTSKVTDMSRMFYGCEALTNLDLSNFDTSKVTDMSHMFYDCYVLTDVIGSLDLSSCTNVNNMFSSCNTNAHIHLKNVPRSLDFSGSGGIEGQQYIIDNYID